MIHIIIPVYSGLDETRRCIESVLRAENIIDHQVTIIDDSSPERELTDYFTTLSQDNKVKILRNEENIGFVATVNRGIELIPYADVILLNSDTEVTGDWLDRLHRCAYSAPDIGTVTPFSNNATICSYPNFCEDNALPEGWNKGKLDAIFRHANAGQYIEIPTAVGFCMYIKRSCLISVGLFDVARFGKGYGEENDFCMRACKHGWRHVLCADTFVYHVGGVSFAQTQNARKENAMYILQRLYPLYKPLVAWHLRKDPARPYRLMVDFIRLRSTNRPSILFVNHRRGGGTERHVCELAHHLENEAEVLVLRPYLWNVVVLEWLRQGERFKLYFNIKREYPVLLHFLKLAGVVQVHFHHLFGHNQRVRNIPADIGVPYDFTVHDYYSICPRITLTSINHSYCGEPDEKHCNVCLQSKPRVGTTNIRNWRKQNNAMLSNATRVFVPSEDGARRIRTYFKDANITVAPHLDIGPETIIPHPKLQPLAQNEKLRVVVIGAMSQIKGADTLEQCAKLAQNNNLPLHFHLIGYAYKDMAQLPADVFTIHGEFNEEELPQLIVESSPHLIWFPAHWPETYSYTLSSALLSGFPIVAPNIGAFPERVSGRPWTWICPWNWTSDEWNLFFVLVRNDNFLVNINPSVKNDAQSPTYYPYQDYIPSDRCAVLAESDLPAVRRILLKHCRAHFNLPERLVLSSRRVITPFLRLAIFTTPAIGKIGKIFSPHNRKMIKAWLAGRWPS